MPRELSCARLSLVISASVACLDVLMLLAIFSLDRMDGVLRYVEQVQDSLGVSVTWIWAAAHRPMSIWLLGMALAGRSTAHDPLQWREIAYFFLNIVYLALAAFVVSMVICRSISWVKRTAQGF